MANFIGRGERLVVDILTNTLLTGTIIRGKSDWPSPGIYTQVPLPRMLSEDYLQDLNEVHQKSSVDIVIITPGTRYAVYVNGRDHSGEVKSRRDAVRYAMLEKNGYKIVKISEYECPNIFRDKKNWGSVAEVSWALHSSDPYGGSQLA